jgi:hypothetical protein
MSEIQCRQERREQLVKQNDVEETEIADCSDIMSENLGLIGPVSSVEKRKEEYLAKVLPNWGNLDQKDRNLYKRYVRRCQFCDQIFPFFGVSKREWRSSTFGELQRSLQKLVRSCTIFFGLVVCKSCFERELHYQPHYLTVSEIMKNHHTDEDIRREVARDIGREVSEESEENKEFKSRLRNVLTTCRDLPAEYDIGKA